MGLSGPFSCIVGGSQEHGAGVKGEEVSRLPTQEVFPGHGPEMKETGVVCLRSEMEGPWSLPG